MMINSLDEVIKYIESCRDTHLDWDYKNLTKKELEEMVGNRQFHQETVKGYNEVIEYLKRLQKEISLNE